MKSRKLGFFAALGFCSLLGTSALVSTSNGQTLPGRQAGIVSNGLRMSLSFANPTQLDSPAFEVAIRNVGEKDVTVNLGVMLKGDQMQLPENIRLNSKDETGRTKELSFFDIRSGLICSTVDDYLVPIRAGSTYTLLLKLDQFRSLGTDEFSSERKSRKYRIYAQLEGVDAKFRNTGSKENRFVNLWKGKLQSNVLEVEQ